jgi:DNA-binding transcriptional ArsR family regulator
MNERNGKNNHEEIQKLLLDSLSEISDVLKTVSQVKRLQILALMIDSPKKFSFLLSKTDISKTALANHLSTLVDAGLIRKIVRGNYEITKDGFDFIKATTNAYRGSEARKEVEREKKRNEIYKFYHTTEENNKMNEKIVEFKSEYQPGTISYLAALTGVLKSLGVNLDIIDLGGRTGYGFILNMAKGETCPSGPTAMSESCWSEIYKGSDSFGWKFNIWFENRSFPQKSGPISPEDYARAIDFFNRVKETIEKYGKSVVIWGIPVPEYGIVNGYTEDSYIVSTFRHLNKEEETPIKFTALEAPGCMDLIYFTSKIDVNSVVEDRKSLKRAIINAEGKKVARNGYISGPEAYDEWAETLNNLSLDVNAFGNSYLIDCYWEGKNIATKYLKRLSERFINLPQSKLLLQASEEYKKIEKSFKKLSKLFPFFSKNHKDDLTDDNRKMGAQLLKSSKNDEINAIQFMKEALKLWK